MLSHFTNHRNCSQLFNSMRDFPVRNCKIFLFGIVLLAMARLFVVSHFCLNKTNRWAVCVRLLSLIKVNGNFKRHINENDWLILRPQNWFNIIAINILVHGTLSTLPHANKKNTHILLPTTKYFTVDM